VLVGHIAPGAMPGTPRRGIEKVLGGSALGLSGKFQTGTMRGGSRKLESFLGTDSITHVSTL